MAIRAPLPAREDREDELDLREEAGADLPIDVEELWQHRAALRDLSRRIVGDTATAEDVVQDTYLRALRNLDRMERRPTLMPWLATVAKRRSIDMLRERRRLSLVDEVPETPARAEFDPLARTAAGETVDTVRRALATLNDRERRLLSLQVDGGLSLDELAEDDGATVDSVRSVLARARSKLKAALAESRVPALAPLGALLGGVRRRLAGFNARLQQSSPAVAGGLDRLGELLVAGVVVAALGSAPASLPAAPLDHAPAGAPPSPAVGALDAGAGSGAISGMLDDAGGPSAPTATAPTPHSADALGAPVPVGLLPGGADDVDGPEDAGIHGFAVAGSPGPPALLAAGTRVRGCTTDCTVLFRSDDGGRSWHRLGAHGITGSRLLVAPGFPQDPRIFAAGERGLSVSRDGGATFLPVVGPAPGAPVAMSPAFSDGDERVLIGSSPAWVYDDSAGTAVPFATSPPASTAVHFAFTPDYTTSGRLFAAGGVAVTPEGTRAAVYRCQARVGADVCDDHTELPGLTNVSGIHVASTFPADGVVLTWGPGGAFRSGDGGVAFSPAAVPGGISILAVTDDGHGTFYAAASSGGPGTAGGVLRSTDGGASWGLLGAGTPLARGAGAVAVLPGGRVIAAPLASAGGGLLCSDDGGSTWRSSCAA